MPDHATVSDGTVTAVYSDAWAPLLGALGRLRVERATRVEWDHNAQEWVATCLRTGKPIARGKVRADVIAAEVAMLNEELR